MENYIVSARKYRPATFDAVVGQHALTTTLRNAISGGKLAHAYLFCGPRGVGKSTCARIFAKTINCLSPDADGNACGRCESCRAFAEGRSFNIHELDAASNNSVDDIRGLIEQVQVPPQVGRYKVFIVDEVHMLSASAFNAFLKTLEEPPAHAIFILATTEKHKILPTILSRCQIYDFQRMEVADIVAHLRHVAEQEGIKAEDEALAVIARKADGGMRDALSIFDQVASFSGGDITYAKALEDLGVLDTDVYFRMVDAMLGVDVTECLLSLDSVLSRGFAANDFVAGLASHLRDLTVARDERTLPLLEAGADMRARYAEQAARCTPRFLRAALRLLADCDINYRQSRNKRLLVELTLIEAAQLSAPDEPGCGRRPARRLKPIFRHLAPASEKAPVPGSGAAPAATLRPESLPQTAPAAQLQGRAAQNQPAVPLSSRSAVRRAAGFSLKSGTTADERRQAADTSEVAEPQRSFGTKSYTAADVSYHWLRYANELPQALAALAGQMKNLLPVVGENGQVEVGVESQMVLDDCNRHRTAIETYLRERLDNGTLVLAFRLVAPRERQRPLTKREVWAKMLEKHSALRTMQETYGLEPQV